MRHLTGDLKKWLRPGMHVKRWVLLLFAGLVFMSLGASYVLREIYFNYTFPDQFYYITLQFLPRYARGLIFLAGSIGLVMVGIWKLNHSMLSAVRTTGQEESRLVDLITASASAFVDRRS